MRPSPEGPDRKYYHVTEQGRTGLAAFERQWQQLVVRVATVLHKGMTLMSEHSSQWYRDQTNQLIQSLSKMINNTLKIYNYI